jgi:hypothetical protein
MLYDIYQGFLLFSSVVARDSVDCCTGMATVSTVKGRVWLNGNWVRGLFLSDGEKPSRGHTLGRFKVTGPYSTQA